MWIKESSPTREIKVTLSMKDIAGYLESGTPHHWTVSPDDLHLTHVDKAPGSEHGAVRICLLWKETK